MATLAATAFVSNMANLSTKIVPTGPKHAAYFAPAKTYIFKLGV